MAQSQNLVEIFNIEGLLSSSLSMSVRQIKKKFLRNFNVHSHHFNTLNSSKAYINRENPVVCFFLLLSTVTHIDAMIIIVGYDGNHDVIAHMLEIDFQLFWCLFLQGISIDKSYKRLPHLIMTLSSSSCFTSFEFVGEVEIWKGYSMVRHNMAQHILIKMHSIIKWIYIKLFTNENRAEKNDKLSFAIWFWPKMLSTIHIIISHERFRVKNYVSMTNDEKRKKNKYTLIDMWHGRSIFVRLLDISITSQPIWWRQSIPWWIRSQVLCRKSRLLM